MSRWWKRNQNKIHYVLINVYITPNHRIFRKKIYKKKF